MLQRDHHPHRKDPDSLDPRIGSNHRREVHGQGAIPDTARPPAHAGRFEPARHLVGVVAERAEHLADLDA
jgi:hypothetical protein